ncbi:hypothetical protein M0811_09697 [Anaeramoeba ignava]|uniref:Uncharacterized protein n=1 Tax=Anaeramoeba ignava TaxID=1746090 RepID=A0A9Q0LIH3_ANAIG|nr:hypothetical protein M0811_09697 [Anaeramoeba ignava]
MTSIQKYLEQISQQENIQKIYDFLEQKINEFTDFQLQNNDSNSFVGFGNIKDKKDAIIVVEIAIPNIKKEEIEITKLEEDEKNKTYKGKNISIVGKIAVFLDILENFKSANCALLFSVINDTSDIATTLNVCKSIHTNEKYHLSIYQDTTLDLNKGIGLVTNSTRRWNMSPQRTGKTIKFIIEKTYEPDFYQSQEAETKDDFMSRCVEKYEEQEFENLDFCFPLKNRFDDQEEISLGDLEKISRTLIRTLRRLDNARLVRFPEKRDVKKYTVQGWTPPEDFNSDLLMQLLRIPSPSDYETRVRDFITNLLHEHDVPFMEYQGNLFWVQEMGRPMLCAHMDTVQNIDDCIYISAIKMENNIVSGEGIIGADDKCGVFVILDLLVRSKIKFNWLITCQEETGLNGSRNFVASDYAYALLDFPYCLVLDDIESGLIRCFEVGFGTEAVEDFLVNIGRDFQFFGAISPGICDSHILKQYVSSPSISVGAYNIHTKDEFVDLRALVNARGFIEKCLLTEFKK